MNLLEFSQLSLHPSNTYFLLSLVNLNYSGQKNVPDVQSDLMNVYFPEPIVLDCTAYRLNFVNRSEWSAQKPDKPLDQLRCPVSKAIIAHTATFRCTTPVS